MKNWSSFTLNVLLSQWILDYSVWTVNIVYSNKKKKKKSHTALILFFHCAWEKNEQHTSVVKAIRNDWLLFMCVILYINKYIVILPRAKNNGMKEWKKESYYAIFNMLNSKTIFYTRCLILSVSIHPSYSEISL